MSRAQPWSGVGGVKVGMGGWWWMISQINHVELIEAGIDIKHPEDMSGQILVWTNFHPLLFFLKLKVFQSIGLGLVRFGSVRLGYVK